MATTPNALNSGTQEDPKLGKKLLQAQNVVPLEAQTQQQGIPDSAASNYDLEKKYPKIAGALRTISNMCAKQIIVARRMQIYRAGRSELYYLGKQKIAWNGGSGQWSGVGPAGGLISAYDYESESFDFTTNFYKGYAESFMTTAAQNVPGVPFHPEDSNRREDIEAAKAATSASELLARWNDAPMICSKLAYHGFTGGLMATYTREVTDGLQFGFEIDPQSGQPTKIPKSRPVISVLGALDISVPMWADSQPDMNYLAWFVDMPRSTANATYPWLSGKIPAISDMRDDDVLARLFRAAVRGNITPVMPSDAMDDIVTVLRLWLRPSTFWYISGDEPAGPGLVNQDGSPQSVRDALLAMFPRGVVVHFAGAKYCASFNESMDDCWAVESATEGRGMARPGIGEPFIEVQDQINILSNLFHEYLVYGIPPIFHHAKAINKEAVKQMTAKVAQFLPVNMQDQLQAIEDLFWQPQAAVVPTALIERLDSLAGPIGQFLTGIFPALVGGGVEGVANKTAKGYQMQLQQSMGRVAFFYRRLKSLYQRTMYNAVREFAANRQTDLTLSTQDPSKKPQKIDPLAIRRGNFNVYPEADEGYPSLFSDERDLFEKFFGFAEKNPALMADMDEPANQSYVKNVFGLTDWVVAGEDARLKQLKEIDEMLQVGQQMMQMGNPLDPSMTVDPIPIRPLDHDNLEFAECQRWANSDAGMEAADQNPLGYQAIMAHAALHQQRITANAATAQQQAKVSMTIPLDKMPPEAIAQELEKQGIHVAPPDFQIQHAMQKDLKATAPPKPDGDGKTKSKESK